MSGGVDSGWSLFPIQRMTITLFSVICWPGSITSIVPATVPRHLATRTHSFTLQVLIIQVCYQRDGGLFIVCFLSASRVGVLQAVCVCACLCVSLCLCVYEWHRGGNRVRWRQPRPHGAAIRLSLSLFVSFPTVLSLPNLPLSLHLRQIEGTLK